MLKEYLDLRQRCLRRRLNETILDVLWRVVKTAFGDFFPLQFPTREFQNYKNKLHSFAEERLANILVHFIVQKRHRVVHWLAICTL